MPESTLSNDGRVGQEGLFEKLVGLASADNVSDTNYPLSSPTSQVFNLLAIKEGVRPAWRPDEGCEGIHNINEMLTLLGLQCLEFDPSIDVDSTDVDSTDQDSDQDSSVDSHQTRHLAPVIFDPQRTSYDRVQKVLRQMSSNERSGADIIMYGELLGYPSAGDCLSEDCRKLCVDFVVEHDGYQYDLWGYVLCAENWSTVAVHAEQTLTKLSNITLMFNTGLQIKFLMRAVT